MIMVWTKNPARPFALNNIDHAAVRMTLTNSANANRYNCGVNEVVFTADVGLNAGPQPIAVSQNQVNLSNNVFTNQSLVGMSTQSISGVLGNSAFRLIRNNKAGAGDSSTDKHAAYIINMIAGRGTQSVANLAEVSSYYNNSSVPLCFYIALRAISPSCNHQKAINIVKANLQQMKVKRTGNVIGWDGVQRDIPIDTYFSGISIRNPLLTLGYSPF